MGVGSVGVGISWVNVGLHTLCTGGGSGSGLDRVGQDTGHGRVDSHGVDGTVRSLILSTFPVRSDS